MDDQVYSTLEPSNTDRSELADVRDTHLDGVISGKLFTSLTLVTELKTEADMLYADEHYLRAVKTTSKSKNFKVSSPCQL